MREEVNVTVGVPLSMHAELKALAEVETMRTGIKTRISDVVRRAIMLDLKARQKKTGKKEGAV